MYARARHAMYREHQRFWTILKKSSKYRKAKLHPIKNSASIVSDASDAADLAPVLTVGKNLHGKVPLGKVSKILKQYK